MKSVRFSGAGNTFLLIDNRSAACDPKTAAAICSQAVVDGVILVEHSLVANAYMRIFNRDGSEAEMCGNGLRCFILFLQECGICKSRYTIETLAGIQQGWVCDDGEVSVLFAPPTQMGIHLLTDLHFLNTGVPHAVLFVNTIENIDVDAMGRDLRFSPLFAPAGANINFVYQERDGSLSVRTYERGVEAETQACGTGAVASALIAHQVHGTPSPVTVHVHSGQILTVYFNTDWSEVVLKGPAKREGNFELNAQIPIMAAT